METLKNIWTTYKGDVIPVIVTGLLLIVSALFVYIASKIKTQGYKDEAQAKALSELNAKESVEPAVKETKDEVTKLKETINVLKDSVFYLAELFNTAFQESSLSPEVKDSLNNLCNRVKNGVSEEVIASLQSEIDKYKELYEQTKETLDKTAESIKEITQEDVKEKRVRK